MSWVKHNAVIVTTWSKEHVKAAHQKALDVFPERVVSPVQVTQTNQYRSFFIGPDGSKEGWPESDKGDAQRAEFIEWLDTQAGYLTWLMVEYGEVDRFSIPIASDTRGVCIRCGEEPEPADPTNEGGA